MESYDDNEKSSLKSSHYHGKKATRRNKYNKIILNKRKKLFFKIILFSAAILFVLISIYIIYKIISNIRNLYNKKILALSEQKNILEMNNRIISRKY